MSLVVAEKHDKIYMGADISATRENTFFNLPGDPKICKFGRRMVVGCVNGAREVQVFQHFFSPPGHPRQLTTMEYMVRKFVPAIIKLFNYWSLIKTEEGTPSAEISALIGYRGGLFEMTSDFFIMPVPTDSWAIGIGDAEAKMFLKHCNLTDPVERITGAIAAARESNWGISEEIQVLTL